MGLRVGVHVLLQLPTHVVARLRLQAGEVRIDVGGVNKYADVAAATPDETWARSAAVQFGCDEGAGSGSSIGQSAAAEPAVAESIATLTAPAAIAPATTRAARASATAAVFSTANRKAFSRRACANPRQRNMQLFLDLGPSAGPRRLNAYEWQEGDRR